MKKKILGFKPSLWLKTAHVFTACAWLGSVLSVILIYLYSKEVSSEEILRQNSHLMEAIDIFIIIPSSILCYFLGLSISWKTNWGFLKYKWIFAKLIIGTNLILFGIFFLAPWVLQENAADSLEEFQSVQKKLGYSMIGQGVFIGMVVIISTLKPWGKLKS